MEVLSGIFEGVEGLSVSGGDPDLLIIVFDALTEVLECLLV